MDEFEALKQARRRGALRIVAIIIVLIGLFGLIPMPFGWGPFGWKLFAYDRMTMHFVNTTGGVVTIEISGSAAKDFSNNATHSIDFRAGEVDLVVRDAAGNVLDEQHFFSDNQDYFYNLNGDHCFAVMDASPMYHPDRTGPAVLLLDRIGREDRLYPLRGGLLIPPRNVVPDRVSAANGVTWIDDVSCVLLFQEGGEEVLVQQQLIEMEARRERLQEARERVRQLREQ